MIASTAPDEDFVSRVRANWAQAMPEIDTSPIEVLGRINRISALATPQLDQVLAPSGVSRSEFDVLCALARSDRPLRASEVTAQTMLSGAATTKLTARLSDGGFLRRDKLERDGRVVLLELTEEGRALVEREFPRCLDRERRIISVLDEEERAQLATLLQKLSAGAERASA